MAKLEKRRDSDGRIRFSFRYIDVDGSRKRHTPDVDTEHEALRIMAEVLACRSGRVQQKAARGGGRGQISGSPGAAKAWPAAGTTA